MARRAVQGYTDKSYYENTRYLGIVATNDPLQEGYFKHLVNFEISDTGQSLQPRKGFLTTGLCHNSTDRTLINLSENTIGFKDHNLQSYVFYDFNNNKGYVVDINEYNLETKLLPVKYPDKTVKYWSVGERLEYVALLADLPNALTEAGVGDKYYVIESSGIATNTSGGYWDIRGGVNTSEPSNPNVGDLWYSTSAERLYTYVEQSISVDWNDIATYLKNKIPAIQSYYDSLYTATTQEQTYRKEFTATNQLVAYLKTKVTIEPVTKVDRIVDYATINKTLLKVSIEDIDDTDADGIKYDKHTFIIEMYYREKANTRYYYKAHTLVMGVCDITKHDSYLIYDRNIASPVSIIPDPMQVIYTEDDGANPRPSGHVTQLGLIYTQEWNQQDTNEYMIQNIKKGDYYTFTPHMDFAPASYLTNVPSTSSWIYRWDIYSTKAKDINDEDAIVWKGNWWEHQGSTVTPVFSLDTSVVTTGDKINQHYKSCQYVIRIVPKNPDHTYYDQTDLNFPAPSTGEWTDYYNRYDTWKGYIENIKSREDLINVLENWSTDSNLEAGFYLYDTQTERINEDHVYSGWSLIDENRFYINGTNSSDWRDNFLTADELIDKLKTGTMRDYNFAFFLNPIGYLWDYSPPAGDDVPYAYNFTMEHWTAIPGYDVHEFVQYDYYDNIVIKDDFFNSSSELVSTSTYTLANNSTISMTEADGFYENGYELRFYAVPIDLSSISSLTYNETKITKDAWTNLGVTQPLSLTYAYNDVDISTITEEITEHYDNIIASEDFIVFEDTYLVTWYSNQLYISEPGKHYYFKETSRKSFSEKIIKVIEFKNILLVFTAQHLYAVYMETSETTEEDAEGNAVTITQSYWASQKVLYNILTSEKYKDVIQVFNEMVLFYSEDGQLFLIKPNTMIDSETRFSLKFFNKAANDIIQNYDVYINERLANYNIDERIVKDDVQVKALISINYIRIFYYVPGYITYILEFDVINNRYTVKDTLTFTDIVDKYFVESGQLYITKQAGSTYFTMPYKEMNVESNIVDMSITNNFKKIAVSCLLDTGTLNLNNHLRKRFRDLHVIFKNLSSKEVLFNLETELDDVVARPYYDTRLEVKDIGGSSYFVTVPKTNSNDIIELVNINQVSEVASNAFLYAIQQGTLDDNKILLDFSEYTSSKLLTHYTSILGMGKVLRLKLQFISKGGYKLQSFGIVYKERRV